eukprot:TRINITY_DN9371_c0_g1_i5.p1 TRINITY_DN9371_c0_g1~~TRINITY_DN9371_c0_g1_i5.p1  ORF type:complete len:161 (+),score=11.70 TRINITY_DN9371_c0_g1_i5:198-680(+)
MLRVEGHTTHPVFVPFESLNQLGCAGRASHIVEVDASSRLSTASGQHKRLCDVGLAGLVVAGGVHLVLVLVVVARTLSAHAPCRTYLVLRSLIEGRLDRVMPVGMPLHGVHQVNLGHSRALGVQREASSVHPQHLQHMSCLLYTSPSPRDRTRSRMPSSA